MAGAMIGPTLRGTYILETDKVARKNVENENMPANSAPAGGTSQSGRRLCRLELGQCVCRENPWQMIAVGGHTQGLCPAPDHLSLLRKNFLVKRIETYCIINRATERKRCRGNRGFEPWPLAFKTFKNNDYRFTVSLYANALFTKKPAFAHTRRGHCACAD